MKLVQTWEVMPDQAVFQAAWQEHAARQCYDTAMKDVAVDGALLSTFHGHGSASRHAPEAVPSTSFSQRAMSQYCKTDSESPELERSSASERRGDSVSNAACTYCLRPARTGRHVCEQEHFVCSICIASEVAAGLRGASDTSKLPCSPETCGFLSEAAVRKFPPYWTQADKDGVHLVKNGHLSETSYVLGM